MEVVAAVHTIIIQVRLHAIVLVIIIPAATRAVVDITAPAHPTASS